MLSVASHEKAVPASKVSTGLAGAIDYTDIPHSQIRKVFSGIVSAKYTSKEILHENRNFLVEPSCHLLGGLRYMFSVSVNFCAYSDFLVKVRRK